MSSITSLWFCQVARDRGHENIARPGSRPCAHAPLVTSPRVHHRPRDLAIELDELEVLATPSTAALSPARMREILARALDALETVLRSHFAFEEEGGYMRELVAANPALTRQVSALREQHSTLRERLQGLRARTKDGHLEPLQREVVELVVAVRGHEDAERELVEGVLEDDLGAID